MSLLDDLDGSIEEEKQLASKKDKGIQDMIDNIIKEYPSFQDAYTRLCRTQANVYKELVQTKLDFSVTSETIETFCNNHNQCMDMESNVGTYAIFCSMLIQNAYDQEYNDFNFNNLKFKNEMPVIKNINYVCGQKDNPIKIRIAGEILPYCCDNLNYAHITFLSDLQYECAKFCDNSTIIFKGDAAKVSAKGLINCDVHFYQEIGELCGLDSRNTRFYSPHKKNLEEISKVVYDDCSFYLIESGSHKEVKF